MRRQYTFIAPKGKESKVRMGRHLFNIHCDTQRILHESRGNHSVALESCADRQ